MSTMKAFVVGGSGRVGSKLVEILSASKLFSNVVLMGRRNVEHPQVAHIKDKIIDFENLNPKDFDGFDVGFCSLGTRLNQSGKELKYKVEHEYTLAIAKLAKENGTKVFVLVTAMFADPDSSIFNIRLKGEIERDVAALNFDRFIVLRPGFIDENKGGPLSCVLKTVSHISDSLYVSVDDVAKAMVYASLAKNLNGTFIWKNGELSGKAVEYDNLVPS